MTPGRLSFVFDEEWTLASEVYRDAWCFETNPGAIEHGRRKPSGAAKQLLKIAERHPKVLVEVAA